MKTQISKIGTKSTLSIYKIIKPSFLQKIDHWLLTRHPLIWSSKLHFVIYYMFITSLVVSSLTLIFPPSVNRISNAWLFPIFALFLEVVLIGVWISFQKPIETSFGRTSQLRGYYEIALFTLCIAFLLAPSLIILTAQKYQLSWRADKQQIDSDLSLATSFINEIRGDIEREQPVLISSPIFLTPCSEVLSYIRQIETVDDQFLTQYEVDTTLISRYTDSNVSSLEKSEDFASYCTAVSRATMARDFAFNYGPGEWVFIGVHMILLSGGWYVLSFRYFLGHTPFFFMFCLFLIIFVFLAFQSINYFLDFKDGERVPVLAVLNSIVMLTLGVIVTRIRENGIYSIFLAWSITALPLTIISTLTFILIAWPFPHIPKSLLIFASATLLFLIIPYLKGKHNTLISLPYSFTEL